jgi:hypothetical protein
VNLHELRGEVLAHGFDQGQYAGRVMVYLNDAVRLFARRIQFYADEAAQPISTVAAQAVYGWPADLGKARYLRDVERGVTLVVVRLREIDEQPPSSGRPLLYALSGPGIVLWPTPDAAYDLALRYWRLPATLVADLDEPGIPADYHHALIYYALGRCYASEDDAQMSQFWSGQWQQALRDAAIDLRFPSSDRPRHVPSMWHDDEAVMVGWGPA